jgi:hypothetical protein
MDSRDFFSEHRNLFSQSEAWTEAAFWIAEERRARLRGDSTEEAFARLAFDLCMRRTENLKST